MIPRLKDFNGVMMRFHCNFYKKKKADERAKSWRRSGHLARVVRNINNHGRSVYSVYIRKKSY